MECVCPAKAHHPPKSNVGWASSLSPAERATSRKFASKSVNPMVNRFSSVEMTVASPTRQDFNRRNLHVSARGHSGIVPRQRAVGKTTGWKPILHCFPEHSRDIPKPVLPRL
jgi:hypothetical protein